MRRSKYNDYRPLRIVLLLLLVVLGLFIYIKCAKAPHEHIAGNTWEVSKEATCTEDGIRYKVCTECNTPFDHEAIPATGHAPMASVDENEVESTCTVGGSHDVVVYCKNCDSELSRETVADALLPHTPGKVKQENVVDSTHATAGSYDDVVRCTVCNDIVDSVTKVINPIGHDYTDWSVEYDEETKQFVVTGCCDCDEEDNTVRFTEYEGLTITYDDRYAPCCKNQYFVDLVYTDFYDGKEYTETFNTVVELDTVSHKILIDRVLDVNGNVTSGYYDIDQLAMYDMYGKYFDLGNAIVKEHISVDSEADWSDNGFSIAYFVCAYCYDLECEECADNYTWIAVRLYSEAHDKTKV